MTLFHAYSISTPETNEDETLEISGKDFRILLIQEINNHMRDPKKQMRVLGIFLR